MGWMVMGSAIWLGILTAISPCPLATNIAAISFIGRQVGNRRAVLLSGLLLGSRWGLMAMGIYLLVGAIGIPVFSGGKGGFAHFIGPTGGYLLGFALAAWVTGFISERSRGLLMLEIFAVIIGSLAIYALGICWLKLVTRGE